MRPLLLLLATATTLLMQAATSMLVPFEVCPGSTDGFGVRSIDLEPLPAVAGQDLTIRVDGTSLVPVEEGTTVTMSIREGPLPAPPATYDLCGALRTTSNVSCPVKPGTAASAEFQYKVPRVAPAGTATSTVTTHDPQGKQLSCITLTVPVVREPGITTAAVSLRGHIGRGWDELNEDGAGEEDEMEDDA